MARKLVRVCGGCGLSGECPLSELTIGKNRGVVVICNLRRVFEDGRLDKSDIAVISVFCHAHSEIVEPKRSFWEKVREATGAGEEHRRF